MDRALFVDTGFLIALAAPRDRLHSQAVKLSGDKHFEQAGFAALLRG
jgi:hypothetical protein